ncbi:MAG: hypothetical protein Hyperionvirus14_41 [Hyperionvirus sp.]|uniref:Uncharacterized protein n=1 Tax=Hyperionvirus sp. TaxID=2487770 RepID=A0A3G5AA53_9VIRU|nr:MAG: hypothetical protein Hyperionvirus14_41 [Hyperionvirus sp.]
MANSENEKMEQHEAAMKKLYEEVKVKDLKSIMEKIDGEKKKGKTQFKYTYDLHGNQIYGTRLQMLTDLLQDNDKFIVYSKVPHSRDLFGEDGKPALPKAVKLLIKW